MINSLDSRTIKLGDTFAQQFPKEGAATYHLAPLSGWPEGGGYPIKVSTAKTGKDEPATHHVKVCLKDRHLTAEPATLEIAAGDVVMWCPADGSTPGFQVSGTAPHGDFNSAAMNGPCLYTHAFGQEGTIVWCDPGGKLCGEVVVRNPTLEGDRGQAEFRRALAQGKVVVIKGDRAEPARLEVTTGQTVFFAVEKASGVAIADKRLCDAAPPSAK